MGRKVAPNDQIDELDKVILESEAQWRSLYNSHRSDAALMQRISEDHLIRTAQAWETFLSDWIIACVNRDASTIRSTIENKIRAEIDPDYQSAYSKRGLTPPTPLVVNWGLGNHPTRAQIKKILDANGRNITFPSQSELKKFANKHLAPTFRSKIHSLSEDDWRIIDLTRTARNAIAHRSDSAGQEFNTVLNGMAAASRSDDVALARVGKSVRIGSVGVYLYAANKDARGLSRTLYISGRIREIANLLTM